MAGEFAVIGLGQFGRSVATSLVREGQSVLAIDRNPERAQMIEGEVDAVVVADAAVEAALTELGLERMTCVVVTVGVGTRDTSIMVTALLRQRGIPRIVTRAFDPLHARVLLAVGAHEIVNPESEMGSRVARHLSQPNVIDQIVLTPDDTIAEVHTPQVIVGMKVGTAALVSHYNVELLAIARGGRVLSRQLTDIKLAESDRLLVLGPPAAVHRFAALA